MESPPDTGRDSYRLPAVAREMAVAASAFLDSLEPVQRQKCQYGVTDDERLHWDYRPVPRAGLPFTEMDRAQQYRALALLASGLSRQGNITALNIMSLENILGNLEGSSGRHLRNPELYFITIFGIPGTHAPWGWRLEGHHLSLNFLVVGNSGISCSPQFFGANPARVPVDPLKGFTTLPREEKVARKLLALLNPEQAKKAVVSKEAPLDIITSWTPRIRLDDPVGLSVAELQDTQREVAMELLHVYLDRFSPRIADAEMEMIDKEGLDAIYFAWAGSSQIGEGHYYRLHGPSLVIEYDNVQNNANHIHCVWRNLKRDWGHDLLRDHYTHSHFS